MIEFNAFIIIVVILGNAFGVWYKSLFLYVAACVALLSSVSYIFYGVMSMGFYFGFVGLVFIYYLFITYANFALRRPMLHGVISNSEYQDFILRAGRGAVDFRMILRLVCVVYSIVFYVVVYFYYD